MKTEMSDLLGIDIPLFAFSHCRDVVAAVTNAGGFGVLGASSHSPEELERELAWIDEHVDERPYGADIVCPESLAGPGADFSAADIASAVPASHRDYVAGILKDHGLDINEFGDDIFTPFVNLGDSIGRDLLEVAFRHPIKLIANALGVPPPFMIDRAKAENVPVAALIGSKNHAARQVACGVDILIAQGGEAGGHCGEVSTLVLVPEVIAATGGKVPVLAAGGIVTGRQMAAAVAMGAAGAWTGTMWLTTREAETSPHTVQKMLAASSLDTVRSRGRTGKPSRQLRSAWTNAWDGGGGPPALPMPLQSILSERVLRRVDVLAEGGHAGARELATYWVGQGVGMLDRVSSVQDVVRDVVDDYLDAVDRLSATIASD